MHFSMTEIMAKLTIYLEKYTSEIDRTVLKTDKTLLILKRLVNFLKFIW
jgi:hypothetical protein